MKGLASSGGVLTDVSFDYQGSVPSNTHIKVHSDLDILVVQERFYYGTPLVTPRVPYAGEPHSELKELRTTVYNRLSSSFPEANVDNKKAKCVQISGGSLQRKFDVLICSKHNTDDFVNTQQDHLRAIKIYNQKENACNEDHPFTHIYKVDRKDAHWFVNGNFRRIVRLLKSLKMDADVTINLSSFMIISLMYHMADQEYLADYNKISKVLVNSSRHLNKILNDADYRSTLMSPNGKEKLFTGSDEVVLTEIRKLKKELDKTIVDLSEDFKEMNSLLGFQRFEKGGILTESGMDLSDAYNVLDKASVPYY